MIIRCRAIWSAVAVTLLVAGLGCQRVRPAASSPSRIPTVEGMVITVRTTIPGRPLLDYLVVSVNGKVRLGNESDRWRLIDTRNGTVTFVDEVNKTVRTRTYEELLSQKRDLFARKMEADVRATIEPRETELGMGGIAVDPYDIAVGAYERELWISKTPLIDEQFFRLLMVSDDYSSPYAGVIAPVFERLLELKGFPMLDRARMPFGNGQLTIERKVIKVEQRAVPALWTKIPPDFRDITPAPAGSPVGRRRAS